MDSSSLIDSNSTCSGLVCYPQWLPPSMVLLGRVDTGVDMLLSDTKEVLAEHLSGNNNCLCRGFPLPNMGKYTR